MKKLVIALIVVAAFAGIVLILKNNKAKSDEKAKMSQVTITSIPVSVATVATESLKDELSLTGTIAPAEDVTVVSETAGQIKHISFDVGSHVGRGSMLVKVDDQLKVASLKLATTSLDKAKKDVWRADTLQRQNVAPEVQTEAAIQGLHAAEAQYTIASRQLRDTRIASPISGVVAARFVSVGTTVAPGTPIANIVDLSRLKVRVNVSEADAFRLHVGEGVAITTTVYPGVTFHGTIRSIGSKSDEAHTYPLEVNLSNNSINPLKAGMFARVAFESVGTTSATTIPREALLGSVRDAKVFVVTNNKAQLRSITVGKEIGLSLEVLQGLLPGDVIVISGQNNLKDGAEVRIVK